MSPILEVCINVTKLVTCYVFLVYILPVPGIFGFHTLHIEGQDCRSYNLYEELSTEVSYREIRVLEV